MKLNLNEIEINLPDNAKVDVSADGKKVQIDLPAQQVIEKVRMIENPQIQIVERIKVVEVEKPCTSPHYYPYYPYYPGTTPNYPWTWWTTNGSGIISGSQTISTGYTSSGNNFNATQHVS